MFDWEKSNSLSKVSIKPNSQFASEKPVDQERLRNPLSEFIQPIFWDIEIAILKFMSRYGFTGEVGDYNRLHIVISSDDEDISKVGPIGGLFNNLKDYTKLIFTLDYYELDLAEQLSQLIYTLLHERLHAHSYNYVGSDGVLFTRQTGIRAVGRHESQTFEFSLTGGFLNEAITEYITEEIAKPIIEKHANKLKINNSINYEKLDYYNKETKFLELLQIKMLQTGISHNQLKEILIKSYFSGDYFDLVLALNQRFSLGEIERFFKAEMQTEFIFTE